MLNKIMKINIKEKFGHYDKRFMVKAPNVKSISEQREEAVIKERNDKLKAHKAKLQNLKANTNPIKMYEKFRQNVKTYDFDKGERNFLKSKDN